ncbi:YlcI/YnfO family protein [Ornithinimicrobium sp. LYQ92]
MPETPQRTIRIPDDVWTAAKEAAAERGENLSDVIRKALVRYVRRR